MLGAMDEAITLVISREFNPEAFLISRLIRAARQVPPDKWAELTLNELERKLEAANAVISVENDEPVAGCSFIHALPASPSASQQNESKDKELQKGWSF